MTPKPPLLALYWLLPQSDTKSPLLNPIFTVLMKLCVRLNNRPNAKKHFLRKIRQVLTAAEAYLSDVLKKKIWYGVIFIIRSIHYLPNSQGKKAVKYKRLWQTSWPCNVFIEISALKLLWSSRWKGYYWLITQKHIPTSQEGISSLLCSSIKSTHFPEITVSFSDRLPSALLHQSYIAGKPWISGPSILYSDQEKTLL